jgi:hypothetical protein
VDGQTDRHTTPTLRVNFMHFMHDTDSTLKYFYLYLIAHSCTYLLLFVLGLRSRTEIELQLFERCTR